LMIFTYFKKKNRPPLTPLRYGSVSENGEEFRQVSRRMSKTYS